MRTMLNRRGMSTVQMIIGVGVSFVAIAALSALTANSQRELKTTEVKLAQVSLHKSLMSIATNTNRCSEVLSDTKLDPTLAKQPAGSPLTWKLDEKTILEKDAVLADYQNLRVTYIRFNAPAGSNPQTLANGDKLYTGTLTAKFSSPSGAALIQDLKPLDPIRLYLTTAADGETLKSCLALDIPTLEAMCLSMSGTFNQATGKCTNTSTNIVSLCQGFEGTYNAATGKCSGVSIKNVETRIVVSRPATVTCPSGYAKSGNNCVKVNSGGSWSYVRENNRQEARSFHPRLALLK